MEKYHLISSAIGNGHRNSNSYQLRPETKTQVTDGAIDQYWV